MNVYIVSFLFVFFIQIFGLWSFGFVLNFFGYLFHGSLPAVFLPLIACIIYSICGILLSMLNIHFWHIKNWKYLCMIFGSAIIFIFSAIVLLGKMPFSCVTLKQILQSIFIWMFHAEKDPMGVVILSIINLPLMALIMPIAFILTTYLFSLLKQE